MHKWKFARRLSPTCLDISEQIQPPVARIRSNSNPVRNDSAAKLSIHIIRQKYKLFYPQRFVNNVGVRQWRKVRKEGSHAVVW